MNPCLSMLISRGRSYIHNFGAWMSFFMLFRFEEDLEVKYEVPSDIVKMEANPSYDTVNVSKKEET